jgi:hypothetical protein
MVEESTDVLDVRERPARERRLAEAAEVRADDAVALGERRRLPVPEPPVADAGVEQEQSGAVTDRVVGDVGAVETDGAQCSCACDSR